MTTNVSTWLQFAIQQMAAESYLDGINLSSRNEVKDQLLLGNNHPLLDPSLSGKTRFANVLADRFLDRYQIIDHHANDATGFSATLMKDTHTGEYTLSFRSTEFLPPTQGGDWERDGIAGADGEIVRYGFSLAQLVSMEKYYQALKANPAKLPAGAVLNVTGYSLGGHLATVFTELHDAEVAHTYTFNGAGRGTIVELGQDGQPEAQSIRRMLQDLDARIQTFDPTGALFRSGAAGTIYQDDRYQTALRATLQLFTTVGTSSIVSTSIDQGAFRDITQLHGRAVTGSDFEFVANSGIHAPSIAVLIEGQPNWEGRDTQGQLQQGNTHSLTLLVDSLALQDLFQTVDPTLTQAQIERIFKAASNATAQRVVASPDTPNAAEGDTLERSLDALRLLFLGPNLIPPTLPVDSRGGGFGNLANRNTFYEGIAAVRTAVSGGTVTIEPLVQVTTQGQVVSRLTASDLVAAAQEPGDRGVAYRYALRALNPFAVIGADYGGLGHTADGRLSLYDTATGFGDLTAQYLADRAAFLLARLDLNLANFPAPLIPSLTHYVDVATGLEVPATIPSLQREYLFGGTTADTLHGSVVLTTNDHLYGGGGNDTLRGFGGDDYLQGDSGNDRLDGGTGSDRLVGGLGYDLYVLDPDGVDVLHDGDRRGAVQLNGRLVLGGIRKPGEAADTYQSLDGQFRFVQSGSTLTINGAVTIQQWESGALGISLRDLSALPTGTTPNINYHNGLPTHFNDYSSATVSLDIGPIGGAGLAFNEIVFTGSGDDAVFAHPDGLGHHQFDGGAGNDDLYGALGHDRLWGGTGQDWLVGGDQGDDVLDGGADRDVLIARAGQDYLIGGGGDDVLQGGAGQDLLDGGADNDTLLASSTDVLEEDADYLDGGAGNDFLWGGQGDDVLRGGTENDRLRGDNLVDVYINLGWQPSYLPDRFAVLPPEMQFRPEGGEDYLDGEAGDDWLYGDGGSDVLIGGAGIDVLYGDDEFVAGVIEGDDFLDGGTEDDYLHGGGGQDVLMGGSGNDVLIGDYVGRPTLGADDILDGGAGNDQLVGGGGNDTLFGGADADMLWGDAGQDVLDGGSGNDELQGGTEADILWGGAGNDVLFGEEGNDQLFGEEDNDVLLGEAGDDELVGGDGDDQLQGGDGADVLIGGAGADTLLGGAGADTYVFNLGDGVESIQDTPGEGNRIVFGAGISAADISVGIGSLVVRVGFTGDAIHIQGFDPVNPTVPVGIETFEFADGTTLTQADLVARGFDLVGTADNDVLDGGLLYRRLYGLDGDDRLIGGDSDNAIYGGPGRDVMFGNGGSDQLLGEAGDDVMLGGEGNDALNGDSGNDSLEGEAGDDVLVGGAGDDQLLGGEGSDTYRFNLGDGLDSLFDSGPSTDTDTVVFGSGILSSSLSLSSEFGQIVIRVGTGSDGIRSGATFDVFGSQTIERFQFADGTSISYADLVARGFTIDGTDFDDVLFGTSLADRFRGGRGNDQLTGGAGDDTYVYHAGDGLDSLTDEAVPGAENQVLFGPGIVSEDVRVRLIARPFAPSLSSLLVEMGASGEGLRFDLFDPKDALGPHPVERFVFADGLILSYHQLIERGIEIAGTAGNDVLTGTNVRDLLDGGAGDDQLRGAEGSDVYLFGRGSGHDVVIDRQGSADAVQVAADVLPVDVTATRNGQDLVLGIAGTTDQLTLSFFFLAPTLQVEQVQFADGTVWNAALLAMLAQPTLMGTAGADALVGTAGNDRFYGSGGTDTIVGLAGHDVLDGGTEADHLTGGSGDDTYVLDDPGDVVTEQLNEGTDTVLSAVSHQLSEHVENLTLIGTVAINGAGNTLDNLLTGNSAANVLTGGAGDDTYVVGAGDTVVEAANEGTDTVLSAVSHQLSANVEHLTLTGAASVIGTGNELDNVFRADGSISALVGGAGNDTYLIGPNGDDDFLVETATGGIDTVIAGHGYRLPSHIENLTLRDPRIPDFANFSLNPYGSSGQSVAGYGNELANTIIGGRANNVLDGGAGVDTLVGGRGDDTYIIDNPNDSVVEQANEGRDTVRSSVSYTLGAHVEHLALTGSDPVNATGNALNNNVRGNEAPNMIDGGAGNDSLQGFGGADTYLFGRGSGQDFLFDASVTGEIDVIQLAVDVAPVDIEVYQRDFNLLLVIAGTTDELTVASFFDQSPYAQKQVCFSDGTLWNEAELRARAAPVGEAITGTDASETLTGSVGHDVLVGNAGHDLLFGGLGNDWLYGDASFQSPSGPQVIGNDVLDGGAGDDILIDLRGTNRFDGGTGRDELFLGTGQDTVFFGRGSGHDTVRFDGNGSDLDTIELAAELTPSDIILTRQYPNFHILDLAIRDTGDRLTINLSTNFPFVGGNTVQGRIVFSNGTQWDLTWSPAEPSVGSIGDDILQSSFPTTITGLSGDDTYLIGGSGVPGTYTVIESLDGGIDTVQTLVPYTLDAEVENLILAESRSSTTPNPIHGVGNELDNLIIGNTADNVLDGGAGNDVLVGGVFRSVETRFVYETGGDILIGGAGDDVLMADGGNIAWPADGSDGSWLFVAGAARFLETVPRRADDVFIGGPGNDTYIVHSQQQTVSEFAGEGTDTVRSTVSYSLGEYVENLVLVDPAPIYVIHDNVVSPPPLNGIGNELDNVLIGSAKANTLTGGAGDDTLWGGSAIDPESGETASGNDILVGGAGHDTYLFNLGDGIDTINDVAALGEGNRILFGAGIAPRDLAFIHDRAARTLSIQVGNGGTDGLVLANFDPTNVNGSLVVETLVFADGSQANLADLLMPPNQAPTVANPIADQTAAEDSAFSFTVPAVTFADVDVGDTLAYSAARADGSPLPSWLSFDPLAQAFTGTPGAGDAGILQLAVTTTDTGNLSVTDEFVLTVFGPLPLTLTGTAGSDTLTGGRGDDTLTGLAGNDMLTGGAGNDLLDGGTGIDTLAGGMGNDTYIVDAAGDVVTENANEGIDTVHSSRSYTLGANVENLMLIGTTAINGTGNVLDNVLIGNSANNTLTGGAGNDRLDGGLGSDTMVGGTGDDTYVVNQTGDVVSETAGQGTDRVESSISFTLGSNVENLTLTGTANINGTGSSANNVLIGNSGNNTLSGGSGNDQADGGAGNDSLLGGSGDDQLLGGVGDDTLTGGSGNDLLNGGDGVDSLDGGSGDDQLLGGAGDDTITGGSGGDSFTGGAGNDTMTGGSGNDTYNFLRGDGQDTVNDSDLFAGNQDRAIFGATITPLDLVLTRQVNDLRIALHGAADSITIQNWYASSTANQIETIQAGNGQQLLNTQVDQLIQAMASFTQQTGLTWDQAIDQRPQDVQAVLAGSWQ